MAAPPPDRSIVKGGLIYTVVAKANVVLVDFAMARGTYGEVIQHMLAHIPTADTRKSLSHQQYVLYLLFVHHHSLRFLDIFSITW